MTINTAAIRTPEDAIRARTRAHWKRACADEKEARDPVGARWERLEAGELDAKAAHVLDPRTSAIAPLQVGRGGELIVEAAAVLTFKEQQLRDAVTSHPDMITASASTNRLELAMEAGVLSMAVDAVDTVQPANSLEKMLAAQLATLHMLAMKNAVTARTVADRAVDMYVPDNQRQIRTLKQPAAPTQRRAHRKHSNAECSRWTGCAMVDGRMLSCSTSTSGAGHRRWLLEP